MPPPQKNPQTSKAMQMLKYCIKAHLVHKQNFELSAKNMLLKFLLGVFKADNTKLWREKPHKCVCVWSKSFGEG